jgi:hypothetical protein
MNNSRQPPSKVALMGQPTRRVFLAGALASAMWPLRGRAAEPVSVAVPTAALGAIATAVGGAAGLLLKGKGTARSRFLDDGRNAARVATNLRDALSRARPDAADAIASRHKTWSRDFARRVLRFELALKKSPLRGKRLSDPHGRRYLLEWAGATVEAKGRPGPKSLANLPGDAARPDPAAYVAYLEALVKAVS